KIVPPTLFPQICSRPYFSQFPPTHCEASSRHPNFSSDRRSPPASHPGHVLLIPAADLRQVSASFSSPPAPISASFDLHQRRSPPGLRQRRSPPASHLRQRRSPPASHLRQVSASPLPLLRRGSSSLSLSVVYVPVEIKSSRH
ncbi:hypothetical protein LINPERPRIM_LOCUS11672, partial [Linum perenne]